MILTDEFVFIHYPKTGGTFVIDVVMRVLRGTGKSYVNTGKHDTCDQIPAEYRSRPILSCVRNPYDIKVSQYRYGWWKDRAEATMAALARRKYSHFPRLTFAEFLDVVDAISPMACENREKNPYTATMGHYTQRFLMTHLREAPRVMERVDEALLARQGLRDHPYDVTFLRMERLNQELRDFLVSVGCPERKIVFVLTEGKILPPGSAPSRSARWQISIHPRPRRW
jgi:hypothetical protein